MESLITYYYEGQPFAFSDYLEDQLKACALQGDDIQLGRMLSHYGCIQIYLGNEYKVGTVKRQIMDEYSRETLDPRVAAGFARCLALYSIFQGDIQGAERYYLEARRWYSLTDWYEDEILMWLESNYWLYFYMEKWSESHFALERWEQINGMTEGLFGDGLNHFKSTLTLYKKRDFRVIGQQGESARLKNLSCQYASISTILHQVGPYLRDEKWEEALQQVDLLSAKARLWKHPWYQAVSSYLIGAIRMKLGQTYQLHLIEAAEIFLQFECKDLVELCHQLIQNETNPHPFDWIPGYEAARPLKKTPEFTFYLFGNLKIFYGDQPIALPKWGRKKAEELFLFLLTQANYRCLREQVIEQLFGEEDMKKSANHLYVAIHHLNKVWTSVLEQTAEGGQQEPLVKVHQGIVLLEMDYIDNVDVQQYKKLVSVGKQLWHQDPEVAVDLFERARAVYSDQILEGYFYFDWLTAYREEIKYQHAYLLNKLFDAAKGSPEELLHELFLVDPLNEGYAQRLTNYLLDIGKKVEAKWIFQTYQRQIERELGLPATLQWDKWIEKRGY